MSEIKTYEKIPKIKKINTYKIKMSDFVKQRIKRKKYRRTML